MEHESPVHVHVTKETPVHVYVRKTPGRDKTRAKLRSKSATKKSPDRRPWVPAPAKTSLRDKKGDLKWDDGALDVCVAERDVSPKRLKKSKKGKSPAAPQSTMADTLSAYETNISQLLEEVETLKTELGESNKELNEQKELNSSLSQEIIKKAEEAAAGPDQEIVNREEDEFTEVASVKPVEEELTEGIRDEILAEPLMTKVIYGDTALESDRDALQKLLIQAELDLQTLNFNDPVAVDQFRRLSKDIRVRLSILKRSNFDVSRLEQQRDAVIDKLAKTDSECAIVKTALYGREADLNELKIDTEFEREKVVRLTDKLAHLEEIKARIQRELYSREGELNRSQARERVTKKEVLQLRAELDAERAMNGKAKLDMEKQALKRACRHHKTKAEALKLQNEEISLDLTRSKSELSAWKERTRRNDEDADVNMATLKESERDLQYKQQKIISQQHEIEEKGEMITRQAREIGALKVNLADAKAQVQEVARSRDREIENAREDALGSMKALRDLPQELRQAHQRLDEALGEIRSLEGRNADLEFQLSRSEKQLETTQQGETELKIYNNKLTAAEIRLDEVQRALDETSDELDQVRSESNNWRMRADERQQTIAALERQIEALTVEQRRGLLSEQEKYEIKERSLHNKLSDIELELTRSRGEISAVKRQKDESERRLESQSNDLRDRLEHSEATNRSMQSYVNFLKSSYQTTFGDDLAD